MPDLRHDFQEVVGAGRTIAARAVVTGTLEKDFVGIEGKGQRFQVDQALFARVEEGKIVEAWGIVDTGTLLRQWGVVE